MESVHSLRSAQSNDANIIDSVDQDIAAEIRVFREILRWHRHTWSVRCQLRQNSRGVLITGSIH